MAAILQEESMQHMASLNGWDPQGDVGSLHDTL